MSICLPKFAADAFKAKLKDGSINPGKLAAMTSVERRNFFTEFVGEANAKTANALFESKLLLKDQQRGMINWAKTLTGIKPEVRRDLIAKIERLDKVLEPEELDMFLEDLVEKRLGIGVSAEEAGKIAKLAKEVSEQKAAMEAGGDRIAYGKAVVELNNYVNELKLDAEKLRLSDFKNDPLGTTGKALSAIGGQSKSITASLDNSSIFNQGWKPMLTNPVIWAKNAAKTYADMAKTVGGKNVMDAVNADIISRPTYDAMKKANLSVGKVEEAFPSSLPEKIPYGVGRIYKASQDAYTAFVHRTRADIFDKMLDVATKSGVDVTDKKQLESIGAMVNSLTGRGGFGRYEGAAVDAANNLLFSPRYLKSQIDVLTHPITGAGGSNFVRKEAAKNLAKIVGGTAAILATASSVGKAFGHDDVVEWDPRSTDFGKIKIGNTRYGLGGGMPAVITLASRIASQSTKSSTTGKITKLNEGKFNSKTVGDVVSEFVGNKASPVLQLADDWFLTGVDFDGNKPTVAGSALKLVTPFGVSTYQDLAKDPESEKILSLILAGHGISVSNYAPKAPK